ncbi:MAG: sporulation protein YqfD, partial [Clostridia bacterium]|nr:sporulation protein YqfD [Clostridia bacterium]
MIRFAAYVLGHLVVRASGPGCERLINLAVARGIYFWNVRRDGDDVLACVGIAGFFRLRPLVRQTRCRLRVERRVGLPFLWALLRRRRLLVAGGAVLVATLLVLSSFVWVVEVRGLRTLSRQEVLAAAARLGLKPGVAKRSLDLERIESQLPLELPRIGWVGVRVTGTRAVVEVVERAVLDPAFLPQRGGADVVARRDGLVTHVLVLMGQAEVREGDVVRRGQVLIRGLLAPPPDAPRAEEAVPRPVRARGIVLGRVWYNAYVEVSRVQVNRVRTGRVYVRRSLR